MSEINLLLNAMRLAGSELIALRKDAILTFKKNNNEMVSNGDLLVNQILSFHLKRDDYGWLSEENKDNEQRLTCQKTWIIDPIDGSKEFIDGIPEYAISVALIENGRPILASVYNPATQELFYAIKNGGAWLNGKRIDCLQTLTCDHPLLLVSRSEYQRGEWQLFEEKFNIKAVGSIAYKLALLAAGKADATLSLGDKNEWDIAAGMLLVTEAGGLITNAKEKQILLNQKNTLVKGVIATSLPFNANVYKEINKIHKL